MKLKKKLIKIQTYMKLNKNLSTK